MCGVESEPECSEKPELPPLEVQFRKEGNGAVEDFAGKGGIIMTADPKNNGLGIDLPVPDKDIGVPNGNMKPTSPEREHKIQMLQEKLGLSREIAEKMVDETHGAI
jgi:hypothetical protein